MLLEAGRNEKPTQNVMGSHQAAVFSLFVVRHRRAKPFSVIDDLNREVAQVSMAA